MALSAGATFDVGTPIGVRFYIAPVGAFFATASLAPHPPSLPQGTSVAFVGAAAAFLRVVPAAKAESLIVKTETAAAVSIARDATAELAVLSLGAALQIEAA